jgi:hypothetical protein
MRPRLVVATLAIGIATAACANSSTITKPAGGLDHATGPTDLVLRVQTGGGFVNPAAVLNQLPQFSLYGDGTLLQPGVQTMIYPGPALSEPIETPVTEAGVVAILRAAGAAGLLQSRDFTDLGSVGIADAATTTITVKVNGATYTTNVYALGALSQRPSGMGQDEFNARRAIAAFTGKLSDLRSWLPQGSVGADQQFTPSGLAVYVSGYQADPSLQEPKADWPLSTPLASFGKAIQVPDGTRCGAVTGSGLATLLPLAQRANQLTPWVSDGARFGVVFRPLLPDQTTC